jgi:hypothetical protein
LTDKILGFWYKIRSIQVGFTAEKLHAKQDFPIQQKFIFNFNFFVKEKFSIVYDAKLCSDFFFGENAHDETYPNRFILIYWLVF